MKLLLSLSTGLAIGAFLLAGTLALAQTASGTNPGGAGPAQSSGQQSGHAGNSQAAQRKGSGKNPLYESKDKANLKPNAGASNGQPGQAPGMAVDHAGGNGVRRADSSSGQHSASRSDPPASGSNPLYEGKDSSVKAQNAGGNTAAAKDGTNFKQRKHIAGVKYEDRISPSGNRMQRTNGSAARATRRR